MSKNRITGHHLYERERFMSVCVHVHIRACVCVQLYASISLHMLKITNTGTWKCYTHWYSGRNG